MLAISNLGSPILAYIRHRVFAGPYHRNVAGNLLALDAFMGTAAEARAIVGSTMSAWWRSAAAMTKPAARRHGRRRLHCRAVPAATCRLGWSRSPQAPTEPARSSTASRLNMA